MQAERVYLLDDKSKERQFCPAPKSVGKYGWCEISVAEGTPEPEVNWGICSHHCENTGFNTTMQVGEWKFIVEPFCMY